MSCIKTPAHEIESLKKTAASSPLLQLEKCKVEAPYNQISKRECITVERTAAHMVPLLTPFSGETIHLPALPFLGSRAHLLEPHCTSHTECRRTGRLRAGWVAVSNFPYSGSAHHNIWGGYSFKWQGFVHQAVCHPFCSHSFHSRKKLHILFSKLLQSKRIPLACCTLF